MNSAAAASITELAGEPDLGAIISAYHDVTEQLRQTHVRLESEVRRLSDELERKNAELARREQLAALGEIAAALAHEIRNPLAGIRLFAALLTQPETGRDETRDLANRILAGLRTLEGIVNDILLFARQGTSHPTDQDLRELASEALRSVEHLATARNVALDLDADQAPETVRADRVQILRTLVNLLSNAVEASEPQRRVTLRARAADAPAGGVEFRIEDQGPGIPPENWERIFEPFFTTKPDGTGLGLPIVHRIVANHGGNVAVQAAPGGGTCFRLALPAWSDTGKGS